MSTRPRPIGERFWEKVDKSGDCWTWKGGTFRFGYGSFRVGDRRIPAHRVSWELAFGKIADGMCVLHTCDNPGCVNPAHLRLGTQQDNVRDAREKGRFVLNPKPDNHPRQPGGTYERSAYCKHGHPLDETNARRTAGGHIKCLACYRDREAARKRNTRATVLEGR